MALMLDDDSLLDAADGFAGWDDALTDDMLAQELEQERAVEPVSYTHLTLPTNSLV